MTNGVPCNALFLEEEIDVHLRTVHRVHEAPSVQCRWDDCGEELSRDTLLNHIRESHLPGL